MATKVDFLDSCGVHWSKSVVNFNDNDDVDDGDGDDDGDGVKRRCCKNGDGGSGDVSGVIHRGQLGGVEKNKGNAMMMMLVTYTMC